MDFEDIRGRYAQIINFPNYFITEFGEVYSDRLRGYEKEHHLHKLTPKNPGNKSKYLNIVLCNEEGQVTESIHRLVAKYFVNGYFDGAVVNHIDGNNRNNVASNLEWTTIEDNVHKSYITSGKGPKRNYLTWELYSPTNELIGVFASHYEMADFINANKLNTSATQLIKKRRSRGYTVTARR